MSFFVDIYQRSQRIVRFCLVLSFLDFLFHVLKKSCAAVHLPVFCFLESFLPPHCRLERRLIHLCIFLLKGPFAGTRPIPPLATPIFFFAPSCPF